MMLTLEDCQGMCGLTEEEVRAIALHENLPEVVAVEMGAYLSQSDAGQQQIRAMIEDDIRAAQAASDPSRALALKVCLHNFVCGHPAAERRHAGGPHHPERRVVAGAIEQVRLERPSYGALSSSSRSPSPRRRE